MKENLLDKKIEEKFETLEETLKYQIESLNEVFSILKFIRFLEYYRNNL